MASRVPVAQSFESHVKGRVDDRTPIGRHGVGRRCAHRCDMDGECAVWLALFRLDNIANDDNWPALCILIPSQSVKRSVGRICHGLTEISRTGSLHRARHADDRGTGRPHG